MSRSVFLIIAGVMALFFGLSMLLAPAQMLSNMARDSPDARFVLQWMSCVLVAVGVINILSRNDTGSPALRAVLVGNVVLHVTGLGIDFYHHSQGFVQASGVMMGAVVHGLLIIGSAYYLSKLRVTG
jgi:hypothetical protein